MVTSLTQVDIEQIRDQVFFEAPERRRRLSRYWLLLLLSAVIATAGVVSDSTATVIGAMIIAPLMTPILGVVLGVVLTDRANLARCPLLAAGAAAVVALSWLLGHLVPYPVTAATNSQVAARVTPPARGPGGRLGHRGGGIGRPDPAGYLRHPARRGHRNLAGATPGCGRPDPSVRVPSQCLGALLLFATNVVAILASGIAGLVALKDAVSTFLDGTELGEAVRARVTEELSVTDDLDWSPEDGAAFGKAGRGNRLAHRGPRPGRGRDAGQYRGFAGGR